MKVYKHFFVPSGVMLSKQDKAVLDLVEEQAGNNDPDSRTFTLYDKERGIYYTKTIFKIWPEGGPTPPKPEKKRREYKVRDVKKKESKPHKKEKV